MEFRLIVDSPGSPAFDSSLEINGSKWYLSDPLTLSDDLNEALVPKFTCISYVWGKDRSPNPFHPDQLMSSNTIPSLSAAIQHSEHLAFWIDALCVPSSHAPRHATLGSMGYIYSLAAEVIVACPETLYPVFSAMQSAAPLPEEILHQLEQDEWVTSVWTYQEVVNAGSLHFVAGAAKVSGSDVLNSLGLTLTRYQAAHQLSKFDLLGLPNLHALEDLLADWIMGGYAERSALRTMTQLRYRYSAHPKNYFYAAAGSVVKGPWAWNLELSIQGLSEEFMEICERKNDYSFIYSSNPRVRDDPKGRAWRPKPGLLVPIVLWHSWGDGQRGHYDERGFWLENMLQFSSADRLEGNRKDGVIKWLQKFLSDVGSNNEDELAKSLLGMLRKMAYEGSDQYFWTAHGIFYLQTTVAEDANLELLVALDVRWMFGAPGLAKVTRGDEIEYVPGVFMGDVYFLKDRACDVLLNPGSHIVGDG